MRLGIFGGTFDPVHYGHLLLAETAREQCRLDQVWFVPAAVPPHKQQRTITEADHRVEMLKLALAGDEAFQVSTCELDRGGVSFTVDTLAELVQADPARELYLILGADSLADLPHWREPRRICELATLIVAHRAGSATPNLDCLGELVSAERRAQFDQYQIEMPRVDLSSSDIRARVAMGRSIRYRTPRAVEKYIETAGLYRTLEEPAPSRATAKRTCGG